MLHWFSADRVTALATATAALAAAVAVVVSGHQSRKALLQARKSAMDDRRSTHRVIVYERIGQLHQTMADWGYAVAACRVGVDRFAEASGYDQAEDYYDRLPPLYQRAEELALNVQASLTITTLLLDQTDTGQVALETSLMRLRAPIGLVMRLIGEPPFTLIKTERPGPTEAEVAYAFQELEVPSGDLSSLAGRFDAEARADIARRLAGAAAAWTVTKSADEVRKYLPPLLGEDASP